MMALDSSIYGAVGRGVKSVAELDAEAQAAQMNKLALLMQQGQMDERRIAREEANALRAVYQGLGDDPTQNYNTLLRVSPKMAGEYQKQILDADKAKREIRKVDADITHTQAQTDKERIAAGLKRFEFIGQIMNGVTDQASYDLALQQLGPEIAAKANPVYNPQEIEAKKRQALTVQQQLEQQWKAKGYDLDVRKADQTARNDVILPDGSVNRPLVDAKQRVAKAGASNIDVKVNAKLGEGVAAQIGPMMKDSFEIAEAARSQMSTADSLIRAVGDGKVLTGPTATMRLKAAQIGDMLGVAGKDTQEKIANTRSVIQNLAKATLASRQQLKGQGAVTESEGRIAEKAASGDIDDLTAGEIKQLAETNKRLGRKAIELHRSKVQKLKADPATDQLSTFYDVEEPPPDTPASAPKAPTGWKVIR